MFTLRTKNFVNLRSVLHDRRFGTTAISSNKVAMVLSGNGVYDGSEIHEASACLVHLSRGGVQSSIYAPDHNQMHVVNHIKGEPADNETRNVFVESARIARGKINKLSELKVKDLDAIVFPGGFGVAKNLSNFAVDGANCKINSEVEKVIKEFHSQRKPIALCCIAPVLAARLIPGVEITLGLDKDDGSGRWPYAGTTDVAKNWGAVVHNRKVDGVVVDKKNLVVTTPAFMYDTPNFHEIYDGIGLMINELLKLIKSR